jgi:hypothetical protein
MEWDGKELRDNFTSPVIQRSYGCVKSRIFAGWIGKKVSLWTDSHFHSSDSKI